MLTTVVRLSSLLPNVPGGSATVPTLTSLPHDGSVLAPGRRTSRPRGLFVVDGGSQCPEGPFCAAGSAASCWEAGVLLSVEVGPGFPFCSLMFLFVPSRPLSRLLEGGKPSAGNSIPAGQRPAGMVGVTGFEPAASSSRTKRATKLRHTPWPASHNVMRPAMHETIRARLLAPNRVRASAVGTLGGHGQKGRLGPAGKPHRRIWRGPEPGRYLQPSRTFRRV